MRRIELYNLCVVPSIGNISWVGDFSVGAYLFQGLPPPDPGFFARGCRPGTPASFPGAAAPGPPLLSQRLPYSDPRFFHRGCHHQTWCTSYRPGGSSAAPAHRRPYTPICTRGFPKVPGDPGFNGCTRGARGSWLQWAHPGAHGRTGAAAGVVHGRRSYASGGTSAAAHRRPCAPMSAHRYQRVPQGARGSWLQWAHTGAHGRTGAAAGVVHGRRSYASGGTSAAAHRRPCAPMSAHRYQRVPQGARGSWLQWAHPGAHGRTGAATGVVHSRP